MNSYKVYQHVTLNTGIIFYIGIGKRSDRPTETTGRNVFWQRVVKKHGFKVEILYENLTKEEACAKETELILLHGRRDLGTGSLVNMTPGGEGTKEWTTEQRLAQRKRMLGKKHSEQSKLNIKKASKVAKKVINLDTLEIFDSIEDVAKNLQVSTGTVAKWLSGQRKNPTNFDFLDENLRKKKVCKDIKCPIIQCDLDGNFIQEFSSIKEAERSLNLKFSHISECVKGKLKSSNGFIWKQKL